VGTLNRLFGSEESVAIDAKQDEDTILLILQKYTKTIPEKEKIIKQLPYQFGGKAAPLKRLKQLLSLELADVFTAEKDEDDLVLNFQSLEHSKKIKRIKRLEDGLNYGELGHRYVYELLHHLYSVLKSEARLLKKLIDVKDLKKFRKLISRFSSEIVVEKAIIEKMREIDGFSIGLTDLVNKEHIIHKMDSEERELVLVMQKDFTQAFASMSGRMVGHQVDLDKRDKGFNIQKFIRRWVIDVFNRIEVRVYLGFKDEAFAGLHQFSDLEFVNRPEFILLVKKSFYDLSRFINRPKFILWARAFFLNSNGKEVSEQMINVFVHFFREWYNHMRD